MTEPPSDPASPDPRSRLRMNLVLYVLTLLVATAAVVVGVNAYRAATEEPAPELPSDGGLPVSSLAESSDEEQQRIAEVIDSATGLTTSLVNIRHDDFDDAAAEWAKRTTGKFHEDIVSTSGDMEKLFRQTKSIQEGEVLWAAVESADEDSARVLVATSGTVQNKTTKGEETARNYRFLLRLVEKDGEWLTNSLEFVS